MPRPSLQLGLLALVILGIMGADLLRAEPPAKSQETNQEANPKPTEPKPADEKPSAVKLSNANAPTEAEIRKALETPISLDYEADPLHVVIRTIALDAKVNIMIDEQALTEEGVSIDEPITRKNKGISAARVLSRILEPLGLTWIIENHIVLVTTIIAAQDILTTVTYPVGDLVNYEKEHRPDEMSANDENLSEFVQFGGRSGGVCPCGGSETADRPGQWLIHLLETNTSCCWGNLHEGPGGSISFIGNCLIVRQTHHVQEEVDQLLRAVRQFTQAELKSSPVSIRPRYYPAEEDAVVRKALTKVISLHCKELPLNDFVRDMGRTLGIPVHIDERALNEEGVSINEPISQDLEDIPAESIVKITCEPFGLIGLVEDGQLFVTSILAAEEREFTKVHDIRDLSEGDFTSSELIDLLVQETSGPWYVESGSHLPIIPLNGLLVVRQTERVHNEVEAILADLRKQMAEAPSMPEKPEPLDPQAVSTKFYALEAKADPEAVQRAILTLVEPKSWAKNGGEGELVLIGQQLVVKHRNEVQAKVEEFLTELRHSLDSGYFNMECGVTDHDSACSSF